MLDGIITDILVRAGIDLDLIDDIDEFMEIVTSTLDEVLLEFADGDVAQPISSKERAELLADAATRLVERLNQEFHGR